MKQPKCVTNKQRHSIKHFNDEVIAIARYSG
jgi:hypothetical protein